MEESGPVCDSQEIVGIAASLLHTDGAPQTAAAQVTSEFPCLVPPSLAYQYAVHNTHMYGMPNPAHQHYVQNGFLRVSLFGQDHYMPHPRPMLQQSSSQAEAVVENLSQIQAMVEIPSNSQGRIDPPSNGQARVDSPSSQVPIGGRGGSGRGRGRGQGGGRGRGRSAQADPNSLETDFPEDDVEDLSNAGRQRWENWEIRLLLEAKCCFRVGCPE
ncbi:hypothetical protein R1flu_028678 [Riccia fluitans]|uniref:Uncharacterized protein n=1 Tax=Riccia fluitans TaxID=41844 RepID=A0ABD1XMX9_9MARC